MTIIKAATAWFCLSIYLILIIYRRESKAEEQPDNQARENEQHCDKLSCAESTAGAKSMALVPYNEDNLIFAAFHQAERKFTYLGHTLTISQEWKKRGVAAVVWDAAIVLSEYLIQHADIVRNRSVLELGAGTGLVGMVAALAGGKVVSTEREEVKAHLQDSVSVNMDPSVHKLSVSALDWTHDLSDWDATFDVILGADIVYIEDTFIHLLKTLLHFAHDNKTLVLLSCKIRYKRDSKFLSMMEEYFAVRKVHFDPYRDIHVYSAIRIR